MIILFKSLVLPILEYCCQLWSPDKLGLMRKLESVQRNFTSKISGLGHLNYWERLSRLNMYSLERRRDRYTIIYVWKIISGLAPNFLDNQNRILTRDNPRLGRRCVVPPLNHSGPVYVRTLKECSFIVRGPQIFNCIPADLRNFDGSLIKFKNHLDKFLSSVPDQPAMPQYYQSSAGNSLVQQLAQQRVRNL